MNAPHARTPLAVSWSGGKDSTLMLETVLDDPAFEVVALLTTVSSVYDRVSIHGVRRTILHRQAASLGLPLHEVTLGATSSNDDYEAAFARGLHELEGAYAGLRTMAFGDLFLEDVRGYREQLLARHGWQGVYPLWGRPTDALAQYFVGRGYEAYLSCVDTQQLAERFVGRRYDAELLTELPATCDPCGEQGEFHTCVVDGPIYRARIPVVTGERVLREQRFAYCDLVELPDR
jgi:uncharacterized protein (TIGR00290 family)